jgi:hypothetical protein
MPVFFDRSWPFSTLHAGQTLQWVEPDSLRNYKTGPQQLYGLDSITYSYNELGFRCDPIAVQPAQSPSVVFTGCSFTEGIGLPLEHTWAWLLHQKICYAIGKQIPYWNLAIGGTGMHTIARTLRLLSPQLSPTVVIALFPAHRLEWRLSNNWLTESINSNQCNLFVNNPHLSDNNTITYETEKNMAMIDLIVKMHNTTLIWDSWSSDVLRIYSDVAVDLPSFVNHEPLWSMHVHDQSTARDGMHPGLRSNQIYADILWHRYSDLIIQALS